jgi:hypothetical protein
MSAWPEPASFHDPRTETLRHCKKCETDTPHQVRSGAGVTAIICVPCLRRALALVQNRD